MIPKENHTARSGMDSPREWRDPGKTWSGWPLPHNSFNARHVMSSGVGPCLLFAFVVGSSLYLRRNRAASWRKRDHTGSTENTTRTGAGYIFQALIAWIQTLKQSHEGIFGGGTNGLVDTTSETSSREDDCDLSRPKTPLPHAMDARKDPFSREVSPSSNVRENKCAVSRGVPRHVAVIMDGHRRFGRMKYGDPLKGHPDGGKKIGEFIEWCMEAGVSMATVFAFSTENWKRDKKEVSMLMDLVCRACGELMADAVEKNVRIRVLSSERSLLPKAVLEAIDKAEQGTRDCSGFQFNICLSYGGRQEIAIACRKIAGEVARGSLPLDTVNEAVVARNLLTGGLPDPDLLIRTSGEKRVSNFLLFQMAYTEMFFVDKLWPEVTKEDIQEVFKAYMTRERSDADGDSEAVAIENHVHMENYRLPPGLRLPGLDIRGIPHRWR